MFNKCIFVDHAPKIFGQLRTFSGIKGKDYLESIGYNSLISHIMFGNLQPMTLIGSSGKSGSFFFYSYDNYYLIKAIPEREFFSLKRRLKHYYHHIKKNPESVLVRIYGMHKLKFYKNKKLKKTLYICIMNNVLCNRSSITNMVYDIKGSTYKRSKEPGQSKNAPFKDMDFVRKKDKILLENNDYEKLISSIQKDVEFLQKFNLIDYSLLISIPKNQNNSLKNDLIQEKTEKDESWYFNHIDSYRIGIIDYLTNFSSCKQVESIFKRSLCGKGVSCIPPEKYGKRFFEFISEKVIEKK